MNGDKEIFFDQKFLKTFEEIQHRFQSNNMLLRQHINSVEKLGYTSQLYFGIEDNGPYWEWVFIVDSPFIPEGLKSWTIRNIRNNKIKNLLG